MSSAVAPLAAPPAPTDAAQHRAAQLAASTVALAPAAMTVLMEAQERLSQNAAPLVRQHTAQKIDQLIWRLDGADAGPDAPYAIRRLQAARAALAQGGVDLQA